MTRLSLPKNRQQRIREPKPDVPLVHLDKEAVSNPLPDEPSGDGVIDTVAQEELDHATA